MKKCVIYTRRSSKQQNDKSTEDQEYECREYAEKHGYYVKNVYSDDLISGAAKDRDDYLKLKAAVENKEFDILLVESLDRLNRSLSQLSSLFEDLEYAGIRLISLQDGDNIDEMHIAFRGLEGARYLKNLGLKTRRGQRGAVRAGSNPGSCPYGFETSKEVDPVKLEKIRGKLIRVDHECEVIADIFTWYIEGMSPEAIAARLNKQGIPSPSGKSIWRGGSIRKILTNETYTGIRVYGKKKNIRKPGAKNPERRNVPEEDWISYEDENLRVIGDNVWKAAQARLQDIKNRAKNKKISNSLTGMRRTKYALSGKLICGKCGGQYIITGKDRYNCANRKHGICDNTTSIRRHLLENAVLGLLMDQMLAPENIERFLTKCKNHLESVYERENKEDERARREIRDIDEKLALYMQAIEDGIDPTVIREQTAQLVTRKQELEMTISISQRPAIPDEKMISCCKNILEDFAENLDDEIIKQRAMNILRPLVEKIVLHPDGKGTKGELHGTLGNVLRIQPEKGGGFIFAPESNIGQATSTNRPIFDSVIMTFFVPDLRLLTKDQR